MDNRAGLLLQRLALNRLEKVSRAKKIELVPLLEKEDGPARIEERLRQPALWEEKFPWEEALKQAEKDFSFLEKRGMRTLWYGDPDYPYLLSQISDPPLVLFVRGYWPEEAEDCVALVGTRRPSAIGRQVARHLGRGCAEEGLACVSGLALGIDAWAHRGVLEGKGRAIAVLGNGIDGLYPSSNRDLGRSILANGGVLLSEYAPGIPPLKWNFPARNRIIAGLCRALVVIEAPKKSGALITADLALGENRDVLISKEVLEQVPRQTVGTVLLHADGAPAITDIKELVVE